MRPSDVRRLRRLRKREAIRSGNGGKDPDSLGAREARVRPIDDPAGGGGPVVAADDDRGILADLVAGWKADDARVLADLARSSGYPAKADPIEDGRAALAEFLADRQADDERMRADLARSFGITELDRAKADPINGAEASGRRRTKSES